MNALLTFDDYNFAKWAAHDQGVQARSLLATLGEYCPPECRAELEARIAECTAREARFQHAAIACYPEGQLA